MASGRAFSAGSKREAAFAVKIKGTWPVGPMFFAREPRLLLSCFPMEREYENERPLPFALHCKTIEICG